MGGQKTAAAALLVSVFVAGALGGAVGVKLLDLRPWRSGPDRAAPFDRRGGEHPWPGGRESPRGRFGVDPMLIADRLDAQLALTEAQKEGVTAILEARQARASAALEEIGPFLKSQLDSMNLEIRALLSPEQQKRFDEFAAREDDRIFRRMGGPWPGAPRGMPPGGTR